MPDVQSMFASMFTQESFTVIVSDPLQIPMPDPWLTSTLTFLIVTNWVVKSSEDSPTSRPTQWLGLSIPKMKTLLIVTYWSVFSIRSVEDVVGSSEASKYQSLI